MDGATRWLDVPGRLLMSALFLLSGVGKLAAVGATQGYMTAYGVPEFLIWPAAAFELGSGILLVTGFKVREISLPLAGWCLLTAAIFHRDFADQIQVMMFLKNLTMAGGFLLLARNAGGSKPWA